MKRRLASVIIGAACIAAAAPATAATVLSWDSTDIGQTQNADFIGLVDGAVTAGLTASIDYTLQSIVGNDWTFGYSVQNTSSAPITASRVSVFGFDVTPDILTSASTGVYDDFTANGNVPQIGFREACYSQVNCAGGGGAGALIGQTLGGTFTLTFAAAQDDLSLENLFVRYQSIDAPTLGIQGGSGTGIPGNGGGVIPEPGTWMMMIVGFGAVGTMVRSARRRKYAIA